MTTRTSIGFTMAAEEAVIGEVAWCMTIAKPRSERESTVRITRDIMAKTIMELKTTLMDINQRLREGRFPNEQAISQGIALRVLSELTWEVYDTTVVWPEFPTGEGRVDFALCDPPSKAKVFVEVKQPGKAEEGVRQALEYAFHSGVPFVVLTDGQTWSFYLPAEQGDYEDRRVLKLDLFERTSDEAAEILRDYLGRDRVVSGKSLDEARRAYRDKNRRLVARQTIPEAWRELVERDDELLRDLLSEAVESKAGFRPVDADIADFLASLRPAVPAHESVLPSGGKPTIRKPKPPSPPRQWNPKSLMSQTMVCLGDELPYRNAKDAMILVLSRLAERDPTFLERCSHHKAFQGKKRRHIARRTADLYPGRPDLESEHAKLPGNWFLGTNISNRQKMGLIKAATEVAGLTFGQDVAVDL